MSLDKSILHKKDYRKQYYGSSSIDKTCRPGGSCPYCQTNRKHPDLIRKKAAQSQIEDYFIDDEEEDFSYNY
jgi:hypothetical protein